MSMIKDIEDSIRYSFRKMPDYGDALIKRVKENENLRKKIEYYAEYPQAMNYLTFEAWAKDLLVKIQRLTEVAKS